MTRAGHCPGFVIIKTLTMRTNNMTRNQKLSLLEDMLREYRQKVHEFPVVEDTSELPKGYKGFALQISDHGNVTLYNCFKNGNSREVIGIV